MKWLTTVLLLMFVYCAHGQNINKNESFGDSNRGARNAASVVLSGTITDSHPVAAVTPTVVAAEYFFDTDPGLGLGTPLAISPDTVVTINTVLDIHALTDGLHTLFFRVKDSEGQWSMYSSSPFVKESSDKVNLKIQAIEYFIDYDPGIGKGISVAVSADSMISKDITIPLDTISVGAHILFCRVMDSNGAWSHYSSRPFVNEINNTTELKISSYEYFFDNDPGLGNGFPILTSAMDGQETVFSANMDSLSDALHILYVRAKDSYNQWSMPVSRPFIKEPNAGKDPITSIDYFFTKQGFRSPDLSFKGFIPSDTIDFIYSADLTGLINDSTYTITMKPRSASGIAGFESSRQFTINIPGIKLLSMIVGGEKLFWDTTVVIQWKCNNTSTIDIEYSADAGTSWKSVASALPASNGGNYSWKVPRIVSAKCLIRLSSSSMKTIFDQNVSYFSIAPPIPQPPLLAGPVNRSTNVDTAQVLVWNKSTYADTYHVQIGRDSLFTDLAMDAAGIADTSKRLTGLTNNRQYWWRVSSIFANAIGDYSNAYFFRTTIASTTVTLDSLGSDGVRFTWAEVEGAKKFRLYRGMNQDSMQSVLYVQSLSGTDIGTTPGARYLYAVKGVNAYGEEGMRSNVLAVVFKPSVPVSVIAESIYDTSATIRWQKGNGIAEYYRIYRSTDNVEFKILDTTRQLVYPEKGLRPLTSYWYRIAAVNISNSESNTYAELKVTTRMTLPRISKPIISALPLKEKIKIPISLSMYPGDSTKINYEYSTDDGTTYRTASVNRTTGIMYTKNIIDTVEWNSGINIINNEHATIRFRITPIGIGGFGYAGTSERFTVDNCAPRFGGIKQVAAMKQFQYSSVTLSWDAAQDISQPISYAVYVDSIRGNQQLVQPIGSTSTLTFNLSGLARNEMYFISAKAIDAAGNIDSNKIENQYSVPMVGDFNADNNIDARDLSVFAHAWIMQDTTVGDIGPASGVPPNLQPLNDRHVEFEDVVVLAQMWVWKQEQPAASFRKTPEALHAEDDGPEVIFSDVLDEKRSNEKSLFVSVANLPLLSGIDFQINNDPIKTKIDTIGTMVGTNLAQGTISLSHINEATGISFCSVSSAGDSLNKTIASPTFMKLSFTALRQSDKDSVWVRVKAYPLGSQDPIIISKQIVVNLMPKIPIAYSLTQNYPNPFNPSTAIGYQLPKDTHVSLKVYNMIGQEIATLVEADQKAGYYDERWDACNAPSGVYIYRIITKDFVQSKKMLLLK